MSPLFSSTRFTRRRFGLAIPAGLAFLGLGKASAQDDEQDEGEDQGVPIVSTRTGDVPSTGGARPGPVALDPGPVARATGVRPIALQVETIGISAEIEQLNIVDGIMQDPTGPWVVSWYEETAGLGQVGNLVAAGHINYWNVGDAVFANIDDLQEGDPIVFTGEDEVQYTYAVQWTQLVEVATMDTDTLQDLVGPTEAENVTLITCGGEFDYNTGEYLSRTVVRGERVLPETDENTGSDGDEDE
jgi:LPXTG-site transpeptidase (sortase) family protein